MATRMAFFSATARHYRAPILQRISSSTHIPKTKKSPVSSFEAAKKVFEANKFVAKPPPGWKERFIVIQDNEENKITKSKQEKTPQNYRNLH